MIKEVTAFEINGKLFHNEASASRYKYQEVDDVVLGDRVAIRGFFGKASDKQGIVCCIEGDKIYFAMNGNVPKQYLGHIKQGWQNVELNGEVFNFDIGIHPRKNLIRF
mgnify:CR=1 FL=1